MNCNNINLNSAYERGQNILDSLNTETLLLEISTNLKEINAFTVRAQFEADLKMAIDSAREVFEANIENIVSYAIKERETE